MWIAPPRPQKYFGLSDEWVAQNAVAFGPGSLPGLVFWIDATDTSTITQSANRVSSWASKVNGYTIDQAIAADQPLWEAAPTGFNGQPAVYSDGTRLLASAGNIAFGDQVTIHMVLRNESATAGRNALEHGDVSTTQYGFFVGVMAGPVQRGFLAWTGGGSTWVDEPIAVSTTYLFTMVIDRSSATYTVVCYLNGGSQLSANASALTATPQKLFVFARQGKAALWTGRIGETTIYSAKQTQAQVSALYNQYFKPKWGV